MKLSKEDLKKKVDELVTDDDAKIVLLEDIEDSVDVTEDTTEKVEKSSFDELSAKYEELKEKYKERFLSGSDETKEESKEETDDDTLQEKEVIDVKEI